MPSFPPLWPLLRAVDAAPCGVRAYHLGRFGRVRARAEGPPTDAAWEALLRRRVANFYSELNTLVFNLQTGAQGADPGSAPGSAPGPPPGPAGGPARGTTPRRRGWGHPHAFLRPGLGMLSELGAGALRARPLAVGRYVDRFIDSVDLNCQPELPSLAAPEPVALLAPARFSRAYADPAAVTRALRGLSDRADLGVADAVASARAAVQVAEASVAAAEAAAEAAAARPSAVASVAVPAPAPAAALSSTPALPSAALPASAPGPPSAPGPVARPKPKSVREAAPKESAGEPVAELELEFPDAIAADDRPAGRRLGALVLRTTVFLGLGYAGLVVYRLNEMDYFRDW
ncbi:uncharacterized protein V1510DRAFT_401211 [Dipodascopsis tothii]|uniref:uncharacterized protein n=1 Tax=Dipodascopsis tothii TaxID=44089 RepID=UPI0034CE9DA3